jgi:hypothetical protein
MMRLHSPRLLSVSALSGPTTCSDPACSFAYRNDLLDKTPLSGLACFEHRAA